MNPPPKPSYPNPCPNKLLSFCLRFDLTLKICLCLSLHFALPSYRASAATLINAQTLNAIKKDTKFLTLSNGIPVYYRQVHHTRISTLNLIYPFGRSNLPPNERAKLELMTLLMGRDTQTFSRQQLIEMSETNSSGVSCNSGLEMSICSMGTPEEFFSQMLEVLRSVTQEPGFDKTELQYMIAAKRESLDKSIRAGGSHIDDVVDRVFFGGPHPYSIDAMDELGQLKRINRDQLLALHDTITHLKGQYFVYVGSLDSEQVQKELDHAFGKLKLQGIPKPTIEAPAFDPKHAFTFEPTPNGTSYAKLKFNLPGQMDDDFAGVLLLMNHLNVQLAKSLKFEKKLVLDVQVSEFSLTTGVGIIGLATQKPQESLEALREAIEELKQKKLTSPDLDRIKTSFATRYFLSLEEHGELGNALGRRYYFDPSPTGFYGIFESIGELSPKDLNQLARKYLTNFRIGLIADPSFDQSFGASFAAALNAAD